MYNIASLEHQVSACSVHIMAYISHIIYIYHWLMSLMEAGIIITVQIEVV